MKTTYMKPEMAVVHLMHRTSLLYSSPDPDAVIKPGEPNEPAGAPSYRTSWDWDDKW